MSQPAKQLTTTPAPTGNIQDIRDAIEALANMHAIHDAALDQISRLEADRTELRNKVEELEADLKGEKWLAATTASTLHKTQNHLAEIKEEGSDPLAIHRLAKAIVLMKAGKIADAIFEIERELRDLDPAWMTRA